MRRVSFFRFLVTLASTSVVAAMLTTAVGAESAGPAAAASASCTFNGVTDNGLITGVTAGSSITDRVHGTARQLGVGHGGGWPACGPPSVIRRRGRSGHRSLAVRHVHLDGHPAGRARRSRFRTRSRQSDPDAACPLSAAQVNAGLVGCTLAFADFAQTDFGNATLQYTGQTPQPPTLALGSASAHAGDQVTVADGAGPGNWWGNADSAVSLSSSDITVDGIHSGSTTAGISAAQYSIKIKSKKVVSGPFVAPKLSGAFTVPCGVVGSQTVTVTEPNTTLLPGTISASASLDVLPGTTPAVTSISPVRGPSGGGTPVTISGCNFTGATGVKFGDDTSRELPREQRHVDHCGITPRKGNR